jgi:hypothetical protein
LSSFERHPTGLCRPLPHDVCGQKKIVRCDRVRSRISVTAALATGGFDRSVTTAALVRAIDRVARAFRASRACAASSRQPTFLSFCQASRTLLSESAIGQAVDRGVIATNLSQISRFAFLWR